VRSRANARERLFTRVALASNARLLASRGESSYTVAGGDLRLVSKNANPHERTYLSSVRMNLDPTKADCEREQGPCRASIEPLLATRFTRGDSRSSGRWNRLAAVCWKALSRLGAPQKPPGISGGARSHFR
jgi:hypothetical protein